MPMPMPMGAPVYLAALPGQQLLLLADRIQLPRHRDLEVAVRDLTDAAEQFSFGGSLKITTRMTLGISPLRETAIEQAYSRAQVALLTAGERWLLHQDWMSLVIERRSKLVDGLHGLPQRDELELHVQPQFYLGTEHLRGAEVLIRWRHPQMGLIAPGDFIGLAEQTGMIHPITRHVFERICRWLASLPDGSRLQRTPISVNLSTRDLDEPDLLSFLSDTSRRYGIDRQRLMLEITESAAARNPERFVEAVAQLKAQGFRLSIDDFGTGYSTMQYLGDLGPSEIKIDRSFVRNLHQDMIKQHIIKAVLRLAHAAGAEVVAEGVESPNEAGQLLKLGCRIGQGFLWQKPMPLSDFELRYGTAEGPSRARNLGA
jgi:EAL domain-containing protein (putative c-di-GMP-specific phosphodiesterase class I)